MILTIKHKFNIYRKFELDIWGVMYCDINCDEKTFHKSRYIKFFFKLYQEKQKYRRTRRRRYIYRMDVIETRRKRRKYNLRFLSIRLTRLFFLTLQDYQFRSLLKKASKLDGDLETNYCHLLEGRLISVIYRTNFLSNMFEILRFVKEGNVYVNFKPLTKLNEIIRVGDFVTFNKKHKKKIRNYLIKRLNKRAVLFKEPRYLIVSYKFWFAYLIKYPRLKDLTYPISIDIQRITGFS